MRVSTKIMQLKPFLIHGRNRKEKELENIGGGDFKKVLKWNNVYVTPVFFKDSELRSDVINMTITRHTKVIGANQKATNRAGNSTYCYSLHAIYVLSLPGLHYFCKRVTAPCDRKRKREHFLGFFYTFYCMFKFITCYMRPNCSGEYKNAPIHGVKKAVNVEANCKHV